MVVVTARIAEKVEDDHRTRYLTWCVSASRYEEAGERLINHTPPTLHAPTQKLLILLCERSRNSSWDHTMQHTEVHVREPWSDRATLHPTVLVRTCAKCLMF